LPGTKSNQFDPASYLAAAGVARKTIQVKAKHIFFSQGGHANSIFYLESGRAKLTVVSKRGKEATVTVLHLRPEFESTIRMPEEVTSVILGSPGEFKAEHNEGEPEYVYVKPITKQAAQSNLLIATKSGQHVTLELVSDGTGIPNQSQPVDFLIEYRSARSFLISSDSGAPATPGAPGRGPAHEAMSGDAGSGSSPLSNLDEEFRQQQKVNVPKWTKWEDKQIETSICDVRQWSNERVIAYSVLNGSDQPVEIVPPQIQIAGRKATKKKKKEGKGIISDQLEIRDYRLSATRLEPGERADGAVAQLEKNGIKHLAGVLNESFVRHLTHA